MAAFAVLLVLASLPLIGADCLIKQNCTDPGCMPVPTEPWERTPFALNGLVPPALIQCPQYANRGCCTVDQNELLMVNFLAIQSAFANVQNGGCPACAQNVSFVDISASQASPLVANNRSAWPSRVIDL